MMECALLAVDNDVSAYEDDDDDGDDSGVGAGDAIEKSETSETNNILFGNNGKY